MGNKREAITLLLSKMEACREERKYLSWWQIMKKTEIASQEAELKRVLFQIKLHFYYLWSTSSTDEFEFPFPTHLKTFTYFVKDNSLYRRTEILKIY